VIGGIVVWIIGDSPGNVQTSDRQRVSWPDGIGYTLFNATPIFAGSQWPSRFVAVS
jgi:hypothetical protein